MRTGHNLFAAVLVGRRKEPRVEGLEREKPEHGGKGFHMIKKSGVVVCRKKVELVMCRSEKQRSEKERNEYGEKSGNGEKSENQEKSGMEEKWRLKMKSQWVHH